jgi:hypothetical protein
MMGLVGIGVFVSSIGVGSAVVLNGSADVCPQADRQMTKSKNKIWDDFRIWSSLPVIQQC